MSFYSSPSDFSGPNPRTQRLVNGSLGTSRETTCSILLSLCHYPRLCRPAICPRRDKPGSVERCGMGAHLRQGWSVQVLFSCRLLLDPSDLVYWILHHLNWLVFFWPRSIFLVHESGSKLSLASSHKRQQNKNKLRNSGLPCQCTLGVQLISFNTIALEVRPAASSLPEDLLPRVEGQRWVCPVGKPQIAPGQDFLRLLKLHAAADLFCWARECVECLFQASLHQEAPTKID